MKKEFIDFLNNIDDDKLAKTFYDFIKICGLGGTKPYIDVNLSDLAHPYTVEQIQSKSRSDNRLVNKRIEIACKLKELGAPQKQIAENMNRTIGAVNYMVNERTRANRRMRSRQRYYKNKKCS